MNSVMRNRSPNDGGSNVDIDIGGSNVDIDIGYNHQLLSIIDLECGPKPKYNDNGYVQFSCHGDATF